MVMSWFSPERLWLLAGVAALAIAYVVVQLRGNRQAVRYANLKMFDRLVPKRPGWRRHVPAGLFLAMLALLVVGFARPQAEVTVPRERATVLIAVDVSGSMTARDVAPDRLSAAKAAAHEFADGLPAAFSVGLVAFGGAGAVVVPPVTDRAALGAGIDRLAEGVAGPGGSAIGEAIATSLDAITGLDDGVPARVVLLSDGSNTSGRDPLLAAGTATDLGVPVDSISFGTPDGIMRGDVPAPVDGRTLQQVADATGGTYFEAGNFEELRSAYADIEGLLGHQNELRDISARFIGFGLMTAILAALASLFWFARLP